MIFHNLLLLILFIIISSCSANKINKNHGTVGIHDKYNLLKLNKNNSNDIISLLGPPSTKSKFDDNLWIYIERTRTRGKLLKFGRNYLKKNNVLVLEFDKYGILKKKEFYNKDKMNKVSFAKDITENELRKENFIYSFLSSVRQKMLTKTRNN